MTSYEFGPLQSIQHVWSPQSLQPRRSCVFNIARPSDVLSKSPKHLALVRHPMTRRLLFRIACILKLLEGLDRPSYYILSTIPQIDSEDDLGGANTPPLVGTAFLEERGATLCSGMAHRGQRRLITSRKHHSSELCMEVAELRRWAEFLARAKAPRHPASSTRKN